MLKKVWVAIACICSVGLWAQGPREALRDSIEASHYPQKTKFQYDLAKTYLSENPDTVHTLLVEAYLEGLQFQTVKNEAVYEQIRGYAFYYQSKFDSAVARLERAVAVAEKHEDDEDIQTLLPSLYNAIGVMYQRWGYGVKAAEATTRAVAFHNKMGNKAGAAVGYNNLCALYREQKEFEEAIECGRKAVVLHLELKDTVNFAGSYNNIGLVYQDLKQLDSAQFYYELSLKYRDPKVDPRGYGNVLNNLGDLYVKSGRLEEGKELIERGLDVRSQYQDKYGMAKSYVNLTEWALRSKKYDVAADYISKAEELSEGIGSLSFSLELAEKKVSVLEMSGKYKEGLESYKVFMQLRDSLYNVDRGRDIARMEAEMENALNEAELVALTKEAEKDDKIIRYQYAVGAVLILFILGLVFVGNRIRKQKAQLDVLHSELEANHAIALKEAEERAEILSYMSHEIRSPLGGIISLAKLSEDEESMDTVKEHNELILASGYQLLEMIKKVLDFARIESGKVALDLQTVWVKDATDKALSMQSLEISEKHLETNNHSQSNISINADQELFQMMINNLVGNAVKYTDKGLVSISTEANSDGVYIKISDSGLGMSAEDQRKLFQPYSRVGGKGSTSRQGTGLGLTLAMRIAQLHGGNITVKSQLGKGSEFVVFWPIAAL
jgi:signal transduction histidine kinase/Tfp pilus assembly protein PilF